MGVSPVANRRKLPENTAKMDVKLTGETPVLVVFQKSYLRTTNLSSSICNSPRSPPTIA
jgi:hypothetical protein